VTAISSNFRFLRLRDDSPSHIRATIYRETLLYNDKGVRDGPRYPSRLVAEAIGRRQPVRFAFVGDQRLAPATESTGGINSG